MSLLPVKSPDEVEPRHGTAVVPQEVLRDVGRILAEVKARGDEAVRECCLRFDELAEGDCLFVERSELERHLAILPDADRRRLERIRDRIERFARAQREAFGEMTLAVPGGKAGHTLTPVARAGCYAPGGRYPLPSSVLMTAVTAKVAGVSDVWVASPRPAPITLAAAALAGVDGVMAAGGAHAVGALAWGTERFGRRDVIAGPGSVYVTAAKKLLAGEVGIDMLAGPSEVVILADATAPAASIAADLLAQAEHAPDALPFLVTTSADLLVAVEEALKRALATLPTGEIARQALSGGCAVLCSTLGEAVEVCDRIAPEHLQIMAEDEVDLASRLSQYGGLFVGENTPTALGDYGAGPNHVLPTGGTARFGGGLSVLAFLRIRSWLRIDERMAGAGLYEDTAWLAREEGLEAHARSAERRGLSQSQE